MKPLRPVLRAVGSLWFAAVLLVLLAVAMACATVFESLHDSQQARRQFYDAWWFRGLLALVGVNALAALAARWPLARRQIGFALTHLALLIILAGALTSARFGVEGQVALAEGQTTSHFTVPQDQLVLQALASGTTRAVDLTAAAFQGAVAVDRPPAPELVLGSVRVSVERYLPDSVWLRQVSESDDPDLPPALEISVSPTGREHPVWLVAESPGAASGASVVFRMAADAEELARLLAAEPASAPSSAGTLRILCRQPPSDTAPAASGPSVPPGPQPLEVPVEQCLDQAFRLGASDYTVRVLRYLPHAVVSDNREIINASDRPLNPAVEVEISGPQGAETRVAFANFPGFQHRPPRISDVELTFVPAPGTAPRAPLELIGTPDGQLHARFSPGAGPVSSCPLTLGQAVATPWEEWKLGVLRRYEHALVTWSLVEPESPRSARQPGLLVRVHAPSQSSQTWLRKHEPQTLRIGDSAYRLTYDSRQAPLGFELTLNRFRIGTYPGENTPRSFESQVTTVDPRSGREQNHVISMNRPARCGGYTLFQSSYSQQEDGPTVSILSVARDPGKPIVFAGYALLLIGMASILVTQVIAGRARQRGVGLAPSGAAASGSSGSGALTGRMSVEEQDAVGACNATRS